MNRRDFVKALAGIPLLGLLVKLPEQKDPYHEIDVLTFDGASHRVEDEVITLKSSNFLLTDDGFADTDTFATFVKKVGIGSVQRPADLPEGDFWYVGDREPYFTREIHTVDTRPFEDGESWPAGSLVITYQESTGRYVQSIWNGKEWERYLTDTLDGYNIV